MTATMSLPARLYDMTKGVAQSLARVRSFSPQIRCSWLARGDYHRTSDPFSCERIHLREFDFKSLHHPSQSLLHVFPRLRKDDSKPARLLTRKLLPIRDEHFLLHQSCHDGLRQVYPLLTSFFFYGNFGKEGFEVYPEEEGGVDVG